VFLNNYKYHHHQEEEEKKKAARDMQPLWEKGELHTGLW